MATIGKIGDIGRDRDGRWKPGYMTHAELVAELRTATRYRHEELVAEARKRMNYTDYPPFPRDLGLSPSDEDERETDGQGRAERADAGTTAASSAGAD